VLLNPAEFRLPTPTEARHIISMPRLSFAPTFVFESMLHGPVAGVDEAGRGPWAGPVVAAAVILDPATVPDGLHDSKLLSAAKRETLYPLILRHAYVGIGEASVLEIDTHNIRQATHLAMQRAIAALPDPPTSALVDGNDAPPLPCIVKTVIKGDSLSLSIAAASIIAKVTRDRLMQALAKHYDGYGWAKNMGYGTALHAAAIQSLGVTVHHRRSYAPIKAALAMETKGVRKK
jgi:ribonuclease HII